MSDCNCNCSPGCYEAKNPPPYSRVARRSGKVKMYKHCRRPACRGEKR